MWESNPRHKRFRSSGSTTKLIAHITIIYLLPTAVNTIFEVAPDRAAFYANVPGQHLSYVFSQS